ncbi:MAG: hypothetical protein ACREPX_09100 [Rhodanobacteraceae bacterium]
MLDEQNLLRLAEMGIDVYVPRRAPAVNAPTPALPVVAPTPSPSSPGTSRGRASVLILTDAGSRWANGVVTGVERALKFARIAYATTDACEESALTRAVGVVVLGDALAKKAGALVPAQQASDAGWVFASDPASIARDAAAKRALWSELRRLMRSLVAFPRPQ